MGKLLLSAHVLAAIIFVGPVTVAVSLFPRYARPGAPTSPPDARLLHRISRVNAVPGLSVPVLGIALAVQLGVLTDVWLLVSIALTLPAALMPAVIVLPAEKRAMDRNEPSTPGSPSTASPCGRSAPSGTSPAVRRCPTAISPAAPE